MSNLTLTTSVSIQAPLAKVWHALTDPEQIKKYLFGTETVTDWKAGSPITFSGEWEGKAYQDKGTILEIEKEKILKYSYWSSFSGTEDKPENYANVTYRVEEKKTVERFLRLFRIELKTQKHWRTLNTTGKR